MGWFNYYGLFIMAVIAIPNILYAMSDETAYENRKQIKWLEFIETLGRYGCILFMVVNVPYTYSGFWFDYGRLTYVATNGLLLAFYSLGWVVKRDNGKFITLWLSATPAVIFLFSGIALLSIPLIVSAALFGIGHVAVNMINCN